jgi:hypothetical protein
MDGIKMDLQVHNKKHEKGQIYNTYGKYATDVMLDMVTRSMQMQAPACTSYYSRDGRKLCCID